MQLSPFSGSGQIARQPGGLAILANVYRIANSAVEARAQDIQSAARRMSGELFESQRNGLLVTGYTRVFER